MAPTLTLEQQQAIAKARARARAAQASSEPQPAPPMQAQPVQPAPVAPQPNGGGMGAQPNITPMGGAGEFDLSKFEALPRPMPTTASVNAENPIVTEQRRQQALAGRNWAAQEPGRIAKEQQWKDELAAMNAAGVIPFKNNGPDGPLELNQERPDLLAQRALATGINTNIGGANAGLQMGAHLANAYGAAFDPSIGGAMAGNEFGVGAMDAPERFANAATKGGYAQNVQTINSGDIIPSIPIPAAQTAGEMGADIVGTLGGYIVGPGGVISKTAREVGDVMRTVPGISRTVRGVGGEAIENAGHAYAFGASAAQPGSDRNAAGMQVATDPLSYVGVEALRALGRAPKAIERAFPAATPTNAGGNFRNPGAMQPPPASAAPPVAPIAQNAPAATQAPVQPPVSSVPGFQRQPVATATAQAAGAPPIQPPPPAVAAANAAVPTPGAVPPRGTLTPIPQNEAVAAFHALPPKTREAMLRTLNSAGMDANGFWSDTWRKLTGRFRNSTEAMDAIRKLGDMPEDQQVMFALELMKNNGGDLETILPAMGRKWATEGARDPQLFGGTDRAREIMDANVPKVINQHGERVAGIAEANFGPGIVPAGEAIDVEKQALASQYDRLLNPQRSQYSTGGKGQVKAPEKRAGIDKAIASIKTYLKRPEVIDEMPDWVKKKVMARASEDMRNIGFTDAQKAVILAGDGAVLAPLFEASGPLTWSPKMWAHLVEQYPTQAAHVLQSAYREAADGLMSGVSRTQADVADAQYLMRLRGESGKGGLVDMLERAIPGKGGKIDGEGGYQWTRKNFGDNRSAERAFDILERFKTAVNSEGDVGKIITELKDLPARHREAAENQITSLIRQELGRKVENVKLSELDNPDRLSAPNLTALSSKNFLNALEDVFGPRGKELADGIRLARASTDTLTSIHPKYNSRTAINTEDVQKAGARYEDPAGQDGGIIDKTVGGLASSGVATGAAGVLGISSAGALTAPLLGLAAGKALYNAYKAGKRLSNSERNQLVDFLFRARKAGEGAPVPRGVNHGNVLGSAIVHGAVGGTVAGLSTDGDPNAIAAGVVGGAAFGAGRKYVRSKSSLIPTPRPPGGTGGRPRPFGGGRLGGAGAAPQITPPGSPPVQAGFFGGGRKPPAPPKPPVPKAQAAAEGMLADGRPAPRETFRVNSDGTRESVGTLGPDRRGEFKLSNGKEFRLTFKKEDGSVQVDFREKNAPGQFKPTGTGSLSEANEVFAKVNAAIVDDIDQHARASYTLMGETEQQRRIYAQLAQRTEPPKGYRWEGPDSNGGVSLVREVLAPKPPTRQGFGSSKLPMDEGSRLARAKSMGFDTDRVAYRGLGRAYDESGGGRRYQMFTSSQSDAAEYGSNVVEAYLRKGNNLQLDGGGRNFNSVSVSQLPDDVRAKLHPSIQGVARIDDIADAAQKAGYDSVTVANVYDNAWGEIPTKPMPSKPRSRTQKDIELDNELLRELGFDPADFPSAPRAPDAPSAPTKNTDPVTIDVIFDTKNIRSKDAKFDPAESSSSNLLAGMGDKAHAGTMAASAGYGYLNPVDANGDGQINDADRLPTAAGAAFGTGVGVGMARGVLGYGASKLAGNRLGAGMRRGVDEVRAQGFGGRKATPPNKLSGPQKPGSGVLGNVAKRAAVGAVTGAAVNLATSAGAQEDLSGKIGTTEQSIATLKQKLADLDKITDPRVKQQFLKDAGFYDGKIDGNIAGKTTEGMERFRAKQEADMAKAEAELVELVRRNAYQKNQPNPYMAAIRDYTPTIAGFAALLGLKYLRGRAAKDSISIAEAGAKKLDRYVTPIKKEPVTSMVNKAGTSRPANLNTFWQKGGASKDELPFKQDSAGNWKPNTKAKPADELFKANGYWQSITRTVSKYVSGKDLSLIIAGGTDAVAIQPMIDEAHRKQREAEEDWKNNPSDETFKRVEDAKNEVMAYTLVQRLGQGLAVGRIIGSVGKEYTSPKPNIPAAATEQAAIKQYIVASKPPPKPRITAGATLGTTVATAPKPPTKPRPVKNPKQLPLPFGGGTTGRKKP